MYLVICYAIHDECVASVHKFATYEEAMADLKKDATNTFKEEKLNGGMNVEFDIGSNTARLSSGNDEYIWTWEICQK